MRIAICGPAAAGKGTIARKFAAEAGISYVDLGLLFRLGAFALTTERVANLEELVALIEDGDVAYHWTEGEAIVSWQGEDITSQLLSQEIAHRTSVLASDQEQQELLAKIANRILATCADVICDGRNAGSTILPDADHKFFVTASLEERARRRHLDILQWGGSAAYEDVLHDIEERDRRDAERTASPLIVPAGAVMLETDRRTVKESIRFMWEAIKKP